MDIISTAKALPIDVPTDCLSDEWKMLMTQNFTSPNGTIDEYWKPLITSKENDTLTYPNVAKVVKVCLALSHGSADVERGFSQSGRTLTEDKASMSLRMLNARLNIQHALRDFDNKVELVPITKDLIGLGRGAHASYEALT